MRSILHDYLAADGNLGGRNGEGANRPGSVFSRAQRDKNKQIFKLNEKKQFKVIDIDTDARKIALSLKSAK